MSVLSDAEILQELQDGRLKIDGFTRECLTPNGYDLRIAEIIPEGASEPIRSGAVQLRPLQHALLSTIERVALPRGLCGALWLRTTWARRGLVGSFGLVDAGFEGTLTLALQNTSQQIVTLPIGERLVQLAFHRLGKDAELHYGDRSGRYQHQAGITGARP